MSDLHAYKQLNLTRDPKTGVISLADPEIEWLLQLAGDHGVKRSLETGLGNGWSAAALFLAGVEEHTAVEISTRNLRVSQPNVMKAKRPEQRFRLLMGSSDVRLAELVGVGAKFDLIMIDGGHSFEDVFIDIHYARSLLDEGGIMVLDDVDWPNVASAIQWHERKLGHIWTNLAPPSALSGAPGFALAAYQRTGRFDMPPVPRPKRPQVADASDGS
jgi:predicted O-methyltransferase YrrM